LLKRSRQGELPRPISALSALVVAPAEEAAPELWRLLVWGGGGDELVGAAAGTFYAAEGCFTVGADVSGGGAPVGEDLLHEAA
jgi:hypothetical protein